jgi:Protein of unknown function (DUF3303)
MTTSLYMVIEKFHGGDPVPVYRRFRERGRMAPEGLRYVSSWVSTDFSCCYQLMETADPALFESWITNWKDLADIDVIPVVTSAQAVEALAPRL